MPFTQITNTNVTPNTFVDYATYSTFAGSLAPKVATVNVANSAFSVLDDTAVNVGGGYIVVTGENFATGATVLVDTTQASAVTRISSTQLRVQLPEKSAATYNLYVVNPDGGTGIRVNGVTYSSEPTWVTASPLDNQNANTAFNVNFSATDATSYAVAAGSTLPAGTQLLANGYFYGTVSISDTTTYSFSIVATDAENQDSSKTFQVTVTVIQATRLYSWGNAAAGRLGQNDGFSRSSPTQVGTGTNWSSNVSVGSTFSAGIKTDGTLWTWGAEGSGQLGLNTRFSYAYKSSPTQVGANTNWSDVSAGLAVNNQAHAAAIKTDGTLWTWGSLTYGKLGGATYTSKSSPTQVGSLTTWIGVSAGRDHSAAVKNDGTLWLWGRNSYGTTGFNTGSGNTTSPAQLGTGTNWTSVDAGVLGTAAIKTDGTLWMWGVNTNGKLGLNTAGNRSSPVQVGTGTNWSMVSNREYHTMAIKTDGTLWGWGQGTRGQLGLNTAVNVSSPIQVGTGTNWSKVSAESHFSVAIKTDGTLWTWGRNSIGSLGLNISSNSYISSPVQIGSQTNWSSISAGNFAVLGVTSSGS
jgi:alpha-tubulin suppressor-like RCC1 family protein